MNVNHEGPCIVNLQPDEWSRIVLADEEVVCASCYARIGVAPAGLGASSLLVTRHHLVAVSGAVQYRSCPGTIYLVT